MVDWERLEELRTEIGEDGFDEVVGMFLEETDEVMQRIHGAAPDHLGRDLHFLKGSALNLGFDQMARFCQEGERACAPGGSGSVDLNRLHEIYAASRCSLMERLQRKPAA